MPGGNQIRFGIGFDVNKTGLNELKKSLLEIQKLSQSDIVSHFGGDSKKALEALKEAKAAAKELEAILTKSSNSALGTINVSKFQAELRKPENDLNSIYTRLSSIGAVGTNAFNKLATSAMTTNVQLKQTFSILESMKTTLANTVKWTIASTAVNALTGSISSAFNYVKALDASLTDIRIVTGQSREEMAQFAVQANTAAQALGRQTKEYTNAALTFYQQGLGEAEVQARTEATLKAQNVTGAGVEMADYLTAVWNGFKVSAENTELYVDKLAAVADSSASNLSELAIAMSKVASTANNMGVDIDQLSAQISTIVATTRQAPETVGNALKTIYARINDIKSGSDEAEISLGNYTSKMAELGINVLDANGRLRDTGDVMEEIGSKWDSMTREQQIYLAQTMAGQRQMNNLIALFDNWQQYSEMLNVSLNAQGALNEKNSRYMESLSAHLNQFHAAVEGLQGNLIDPDGLNPVIDAGTALVNLLSQFVGVLGGMQGVLLATGSILLRSFSSNIADGIVKFNQNLQAAKDNAAALQAQLELSNAEPQTMIEKKVQDWNREATQYQQSGIMTPDQRAVLNEVINQYEVLAGKITSYKEAEAEAINYLKLHEEALESAYPAGENYQKVLENIAKTNKIDADSAKNLLISLKEEMKTFDSLGDELKDITKAYENVQNAKDTRKISKKTKKNNVEEVTRKLRDNLSESLDTAQNVMLKKLDPNSDIFKKYQQEFNDLQQNINSAVDPSKFTERFVNAYTELLAILKDKNIEIQGIVGEAVKGTLDTNLKAIEQYEAIVEEILSGANTKQFITSIIDGLGALAGIVSSLTTVKNAFAALGDESLSTGDKIARFIEGLGYGLPMLISSFGQLTTAFGAARLASAKLVIEKLKMVGVDAATVASELSVTEVIRLQIFAIKEKTLALWENTAAWIANHAAMLGWIAVAAIVIGLIVHLIKQQEEKAHAEERAAEAAKKHAEQMKQGYEDAKQSFEDLKAAIEDYKDAKDALDQLVVGTQEWNEALQKTYDTVLQLLETYPELAQYITYDANGVPSISNEGIDRLVQLQQQDVQATQQRYLLAERDKLEADLDLLYKRDAQQAGLGGAQEEVKDFYNLLANNAEMYNDFIALQKNLSQENLASFIEKYGSDWTIMMKQLVASMAQNNQNIQESIAMVKTNTAAIETQTKLFTDSIYAGNATYRNYKYKDAVVRETDKAYQKALEQILSSNSTMGLWAKAIGDKDFFAKYAEQNNIEPGHEFTSEEIEALAMAYAEEQARKAVAENSTELLNNIKEATDQAFALGHGDEALGDAYAKTISNFIGKNIIDFSKQGIEEAKEALSALTIEQANNLLDSGVFETEAYKDAGLYKSAFSSAINAYRSAIIDTLKDESLVSDDVLDIYGLDRDKLGFADIDQVSLDNIQQLSGLLSQAKEIGPEAVNLIKELFKGVDKNQYTALLNVLSTIDRNTSVDDLRDRLEDAGVQVENFDSQLLLLLNLFSGEGNIGDAVLASAEAIKKAKDIISDLHYGDEISEDDFAELQRLGLENLSDYFTMTLDGTYRLVGSSKELRDAINQMQIDNFTDRVEQIKNNLKILGDAHPEDIAQVDTNDFNQKELADQDSRLYQQISKLLDIIIAGGGTASLSVEQAQGYKEALANGEFTLDQLDTLNAAVLEFGTLEEHIKVLNDQLGTMEGTLSLRQLDSDVDTEEFERMADYLTEYGGEIYGISEDLKGNYELAKLIAEEFLRADAAAESVNKNIDKWTRSLADPQHNMEDYLESLDELDNAYKDLLNLSNDLELSEEFLSSAENLQLMQKAIEGGEEGIKAYDQLVKNAAMDLAEQAVLDTENGVEISGDIKTEDLLANLSGQIDNVLDQIRNKLDLGEIEIGSEINDTNLLNQLESIVNAAGMTAEEATNFLSLIGFDAEVVEEPASESASKYTTQEYVPPKYGFGSVPYGGVTAGIGAFFSPTLEEEGHWESRTAVGTEKGPKPFALKIKNAKANANIGGTISHKKLGGSSGGRGSSGRSGGSGGSKKKDPTKPFKSKIDPYHDVNIKIGNTKEGLDKLEKQRDKLIGKAAVDNLRKQVDLMEQEKELLREKAEIAKSELQRQGQELANLGAIFDANGDIANYNQLLLDKQNQINQAIEYGNTLQGDQRDAYDKYIKDLEQEYKDLETAIKDYDSTQQLLDDLELDYADIINEQIEKAVEAFDLEIELHLDLKDAQKEFNEFRKKIIDQIQDDEFGRLAEATARNYQNYYNVGADGNVGGIIPELRQHVQQIYNELQVMTNGGFSQIYGDNLAAAAEDLKKYNDELMKNLEEAQDVIDETHKNFLDAIDSLSDAFDKQQEAFDKIDTFLEHDIELIQLVRGEEDYAALTGLWEQQVATDAQRLDKLRQQQDYWREQIDQYEEGTDEWEAAMENWQNSFAALNEAMINSVKNLQSQWENSINAIMKDLRNQAFGGNMNSALEQWEKMEWHSDRYLDSLSRANGLLDLQNQYTKAINETDDPKLRQQLTDLEEQQLEALSNKEHLREIDLKIAQQQLTVMQAQMALEDAQQSKTKMRLRRDSQGNYTYQYVADEDNIAEKTQEYANALEEYRTMVKDSLHEDLQDLSDYTQEFFDKIQEAQMQFGDDAEALQARIAEITEQYTGPEGYITRLVEDANYDQQELQKATFTQAVELYGQLGEAAFNAFTGPDQSILAAAQELLDANNGKIPTLLEMFKDDTYQQFLDGITQDTWNQLLDPDHGLFHDWNSSIASIAQNYQEKFLPEVADAMYKLQQVHQAYLEGLGTIQNAAGRTFGQVAAGLDADTGYSYSLITATDELVEAQKAQVEQANEVYNALKRNEEAFKDQTKAAIDAANAMFLYWLTLNGQTTSSLPYSVEGYTGVRSNPSSTKASPNNYSSNSSGSGSGSGGSGSGTNGSGGYSSGYTGSGSGANLGAGGSGRRWATTFASGGYTGNWADIDGRIAVLHQKELVLNEEDTKNVLNAVNITRAITSGVSSMAAAALSNLSGGRGYSTLESTTDSILQNVVINADFPAVQDAAQIKQAFNELVNIASQRASKNRRAY